MNNNPVRLQKQEEKTMKIEDWLLAHANILLPLLIILLIILFIGLCFSIMNMGGTNVTMLESGQYYNHFNDII